MILSFEISKKKPGCHDIKKQYWVGNRSTTIKSLLILRLLRDLSMRNLFVERTERSLDYNRGPRLKLSSQLSHL